MNHRRFSTKDWLRVPEEEPEAIQNLNRTFQIVKTYSEVLQFELLRTGLIQTLHEEYWELPRHDDMHSRHTGTQILTSDGSRSSQLRLSWDPKTGPLDGPNTPGPPSEGSIPRWSKKACLSSISQIVYLEPKWLR